jgi:hypothetical protein
MVGGDDSRLRDERGRVGPPSRGLPTGALVDSLSEGLVDQTGASWNRIAAYLRQLRELQKLA